MIIISKNQNAKTFSKIQNFRLLQNNTFFISTEISFYRKKNYANLRYGAAFIIATTAKKTANATNDFIFYTFK